MLKLNLQYFGHLNRSADSLEKTLTLGKIEGRRRRGRQRMRCLIASPTQWTWIWANSGRQWRTEEPDMLQYMGFQRVRLNSNRTTTTETLLGSRLPHLPLKWLCGRDSPSMRGTRDELPFQPRIRSVSREKRLWHHAPNALCSQEERSQVEAARTSISCLHIHLPIHHSQSALFICTHSVI